VLGNLEKQDISVLMETTGNQVSDISTGRESGALKLTSFAEHIRAFLQVQNGCNSFCAYCIVPFARGRSRSVLPADVLDGVHTLAANGYKEVVLTGIHLGAYGLDLTSQTSLTSLVREIEAGNIIPRLRIGSIEPNEIDDDLLRLMAESKIICPHLHLPMQSGSDSILERMGRRYKVDYFRELVARVLVAMPDAFIGADVIAGFPGETDAEFKESIRVLEELPFSDLHIFPFSSRPGTRAAVMTGQLTPHLIKKRAARLRDIAEQKKKDFLKRSIGNKLNVLVQGYDSHTGLCNGLSRNYIVVTFPGEDEFINRELVVTILGSDEETCSGIIDPTTPG
jgi:threonylcarbamoyladenosine tRNA methylthiotransferase MtaB